ncbi:MAG: hypothetical protein ABI837_10085 [Acidobacteriota bacterium]
MARGFESKGAQSNREDAETAKELHTRRLRSREEIEHEKQRESLLLSHRRVQHELEATQSDLRRRSLQAALAHLEGELGKLN